MPCKYSYLFTLTLSVGRQEGHLACKKLGAGVVICLERGADLHMAQRMQLPLTVSCFGKFQIGFTFLVPYYPGSPGQRAVKRVCVCVLLTYTVYVRAGAPVIWELASVLESRGMSATLLCRSHGNPPPTITFRRLRPPADITYRTNHSYVSAARLPGFRIIVGLSPI